MVRNYAAALSAFVCCVSLAAAQGSYKATAGGPPSAVPAAMQGVLEPAGVQFSNSQGQELCEIWWRKGIPTKGNTPASSDVLYGGLSIGELVGVVDFPAAAKDYRGQPLKPGYYSMRYALIPQDGNHMGVSTYRDFLLLTPVADDTNPSQNLSFEDVVKASRLASGTGHPSVMMLEAPSASGQFPAAVQDDQGNWALDVKLNTTSAAGGQQQLPFAMVLVGQYQGD